MPAPPPPQTKAAREAAAKHTFKAGQVNRAYGQVIELQNLVFDAAKAEGSEGKSLAALTRAWCDLEERRRVLTGKPLPGSYRPERKAKAAASKGFAALKVKPAPQGTTAPATAEAPASVPTIQPVVVSPAGNPDSL